MPIGVDTENVLYDINEEAASFYQTYLHDKNPKAVWQYLFKREIKGDSVVWNFRAGASSSRMDDLYKHLKSKGFSSRDLLASGLISKGRTGRYYDRFRSRIMLPICNVAGQVVGFTGLLYIEADGQATYLLSPETTIFKKRDNLYGLNIAKQCCHDSLILVEGVMDVIMLNQAGFCNVVAPLGIELTEAQVKLISQHTKELIICFDGDRSGATATRKALDMATNVGLKACAVTMPDGMDPTAFVRSYGTDEFFYLLSFAQRPLAYVLSAAERDHPITDDESLVRYLQTAVQILAEEKSALAVDVLAGTIAKKYEISKDVILAEVKRYQHKFSKERK